MAQQNEEKLNCFFVTPIGRVGSDDRKRADDILKHVLRPALAKKFEIVRADEIDDPGTISGDIVVRLHGADLVVADLTGTNPNVMYEVGIRHSFSKPIVQICQTGQNLPFDLADERTIFFDLASLDEIADAKDRISRSANRAMDAKPFRSPVVRALEFETLLSDAGSTPLSRTLIEKLEELTINIEEVQGDVGALENGLSNLYFSSSSEGLDVRTSEAIQSIAQKFDLLGPTDILELAKAAKFLSKNTKC